MANTKSLYVLRSNINRVKIGISANPVLRMAQIKSASPIKIELDLVFFCELSCRDAEQVEKRLHSRFARWRAHGEWFSISAHEAVQAAQAMSAEYDPVEPRQTESAPNRRYVAGGISLARRSSL